MASISQPQTLCSGVGLPAYPRAEFGIVWSLVLLYALNISGFQFVALLPNLVGVPAGGLSLALRLLVIGVSIAVVSGWLLQGRPFHRGWAWLGAALVFTLLLYRIGDDAAVRSMTLPRPSSEYLLWLVGACMIPMVGMFEKPNRSTLVGAWWVCLALTAMTAVLLLLLAVTGKLGGAWANRLSTELINPILVGIHGASLTVMALTPPRRVSSLGPVWLLGPVLAVLAAVGVVLTVASGSRGPLLAIAVAAAVLFLVPRKNASRGRTLFIAAGFGCALAALIATYFLTRDSLEVLVLERIFASVGDASTSYRQLAFAGALQQFSIHPWFGATLVELRTNDYPHNLPIEALMSLGVFGFLALLALMIGSFMSALHVIRDLNAARWVAGIYLLYLIAAQTSGSLYLSYAFWCFTAAIIAVGGGRVFRLARG